MEDNNATEFYPLYGNTADSEFNNQTGGAVTDNNNKFTFIKKASGGFLTNSQAITEEPLFSLFLSGGIAGLDESLLSGIMPDAPAVKTEGTHISRQSMNIVPDAQLLEALPHTPPISISPAKSDSGFDSSSPKRKLNSPHKADSSEASNQSTEDEKTMKRQRRLVKNREAAQLFRQRQKAYIQDLEKKVQDLGATNNDYRARVELLNSENKLIKEQLLYLRNFVTQAVSHSFPKGTSPPGMPAIGITSSTASLALSNLASSPSLQGTLSHMMNTVTGTPLHSSISSPPTNSNSHGSMTALLSSPLSPILSSSTSVMHPPNPLSSPPSQHIRSPPLRESKLSHHHVLSPPLQAGGGEK